MKKSKMYHLARTFTNESKSGQEIINSLFKGGHIENQECTKCKFQTSRPKLLRKHSKRHWGNHFQGNSRDTSSHFQINSFFNCSYCSHIERDFKNLLKHVQLTHLEKKDYRKSEIDIIKKRLEVIYESLKLLNLKYSSATNPMLHLNLKENNNFMHNAGRSSSEKRFGSVNDKIENQQSLDNSKTIPVRNVDMCPKNEILKSDTKIHCAEMTVKKAKDLSTGVGEVINNHSKCEKLFTNRYALKQHQISCATSKVTLCQKCKCVFVRQNISRGQTNTASKSLIMCHRCKADLLKTSTSSDPIKTYSSVCAAPLIKTQIIPEKNTSNIKHNAVTILCSVCQATFLTKVSLEQHLKITGHDEIATSCSQNMAKFTAKEATQHKSSTKREFISTNCSVCKKQFAKVEHLEQHMLSDTHRNMTFFCSLCTLVFTTLEGLEQHKINTGHKKIKILCTECMAPFASKDSLDQHLRSTGHKLKASGSVCFICKAVFSKKILLEQHIEDTGHQSVNISSLGGASFTSSSAFDQRMRGTNHKKNTYSCSLCKRGFEAKKDLEQHMASAVHKNDFVCPPCGSIFPTKDSLDQHINATGHKSLNYVCSECGASFASSGALNQHVISTRHKEISLSCSVCQKQFAAKKDLEQHMASAIHKNDFVCPVCRSSFSTKDSLEQHINATGHKSFNYVCSVCGASFASSGALNQHVISTRHAEISVSCYVCQKEFATKKDLAQHMASAVHRKDFVCPVCGLIFSTKESLKQHIELCGHKLPKIVC